MEFGHLLTSWTIRLALLAYVATALLGVPATWPAASGNSRFRWSRALWLAGSLLAITHVAAALHFYHGWSHARALADTARQTRELMGWAFGEGIYFSYGFVLMWLADACWWCLAPVSYVRRPWWAQVVVHAYLAFIAFNGAIIFERGVTRWSGLGVVPVLVILAWRRYRERGHPLLPAVGVSPTVSPSSHHA